MTNSHMRVPSICVEHKGRPIGSKVSGILVYSISKWILRLLLYSQGNQKVFVGKKFMIKTIR